MFYPHRPDYQCPDCKKGTMKWQAEVFSSFSNTGRHYCDNPDCVNHRDNYFKILTRSAWSVRGLKMENKLRERLIQKLEPYHREIHLHTGYGEAELADQILAITDKYYKDKYKKKLEELLDGLSVIKDDEIREIIGLTDSYLPMGKRLVQKQLSHTKEEIRRKL